MYRDGSQSSNPEGRRRSRREQQSHVELVHLIVLIIITRAGMKVTSGPTNSRRIRSRLRHKPGSCRPNCPLTTGEFISAADKETRLRLRPCVCSLCLADVLQSGCRLAATSERLRRQEPPFLLPPPPEESETEDDSDAKWQHFRNQDGGRGPSHPT